jgi:hypothetical protein
MQEAGGLGRWENAEGEVGDEDGKGCSQICMVLPLMALESWGPALCARHSIR